MKFLKTLFMVMFAMIAFGSIASPASAQTTEPTATTTSTPTSHSGWGGFDSGDVLVINMVGAAAHQGMFGAAFDAGQNGTGEAGAEKEGYSSIDLQLAFSTCGATDCTQNNGSANLESGESGYSWAKAFNTTSGVPVVTQNIGVASAALQFGLGVNACPSGCAVTPE